MAFRTIETMILSTPFTKHHQSLAFVATWAARRVALVAVKMVLAVWTLRFAALEACHALAIGAEDFMALVANILGVAGIAKILLAGVAKEVGRETVLRAKLAFVRIRSDAFVAK